MLTEIYEKVAKELGEDPEVIRAAYHSQWQFIKDKIEALPLKGELSEEDYNKLRTSFNIPSLGKIHTSYDKILKAKRRYEYMNKLMKEND